MPASQPSAHELQLAIPMRPAVFVPEPHASHDSEPGELAKKSTAHLSHATF
jgi:hypothetical protein